MLASHFAHTNPVANMLLGVGVVLLLAGLIVFRKQVGRVIDWVTLRFTPGVAGAAPAAAPGTARVLWVDDRPGRGSRVVEVLTETGVPVDLARSTDEALTRLAARPYGLVVSDLSRVEDETRVPDAGLRLLDEVDRTVPFVVFTPSASATDRQRALAGGALAVVSSDDELLTWIRATGLVR